MELSKQAIGRAGEFQAAAIFELHGIVTTHVDVHGVDLWVQTPSNRRVTIQVKSTRRPSPTKQKRSDRYAFQMRNSGERSADVYCFVALDLGLLRLVSLAELSNAPTRHCSVASFNEQDMLADIKRYLY